MTKEKFMTNEIKVINEQEVLGRDFKIYGDFENPLFLAKDVAEWIGHSNVTDMVSRVDNDEVTKFNLGGLQGECNFLTEDGLYEVLMQSRKPIAKQFKKKVKEILKTLRTKGGYVSNVELMVNTYFSNLPDDQKFLVKSLFENVEAVQKENSILSAKNELLVADTLTWADRPLLNSLVRRYAGFACNGEFGTAWVEFKKELLYRYSINVNSRITAYLNKTGKKTKPKTLEMLSNDELVDALKIIISMCENKKVDISDLLTKKKSENVA